MRIPSFLLPTALGSVVVSGASFNVADKAAYTLFDAPLSAEAPPKDLFPADDTLKSWLPPRFVATSGSPIPTNNWWGNIIAASGDSTVQPVWSVPYALRPLVFEAPFGLAANYPYTTRQLIGSSNNGNANQFLTHWFVNDFIFSAAEWTAAPTFQVASWDDMGVSVLFYSSATAKMTATLVSGMAYVTTKYEQLTPKFASAAAVTSVNGASISAGAKVSGMRFVITLNNGEKWVLYTEKSITLSLVDLTTLQATGVYSGYARVAIVTSDAQLAALDKSYKCLLDGSNVEAQDATNYIFHLKTSGDCSNGLFHYLQVHHMDTLDTTSASAVAGATVMSSTRGPMAGVVTRTSPPVLRFTETQSVPVDFYPPRRPLSSVVADQKIKEALIADINATWNVPTDGSYYFNGKAVNKYANLCLMANDDVVSGSDKAILLGQCLEKLRAVLAPFGSNTWSSPLNYDTVYRGILSSLGLNTKNADLDFGNSVYNDHHYHYGYWIATAAIVNYLDSAWSGLAQLNRVATFLIRDVANPSKSDTAFPKFRQLDWFRGHSFSHGITPMNDGKDEESLSEDINFHYAVALFGKATGRTGLANVGQLMLKLNTRAAQNYFLMTDDNRVFPPSIIPNKVPGILFDNKVAYTTWFSSDKFAIHGIQMIPASPVTEFYRSTQFVKEEWNGVLSKISAVVDDNQWNPWLSLLYINYATIDPTLAMQKLQTVNMDDGLTRSWALYMAATRPAAMNINPTPTTSVPNTTAPPVTTAPAATTTAPVTTAPTPTTTAPAPTTTAPATTAPAPVATSPSPTTAAPATTAPAPTTATPTPTTPSPSPTTLAPATTSPPPTTTAPAPASGAWCGSDVVGVQACAAGEYCQPWDPYFYQCRVVNTATCGVQQTNVDFYGDDLTTIQVLLPELCCDKCRATTGCVAYTFVNYNADGKAYCYLKKGFGTKRTTVGAVSAVIVPVTPAPTTPAPTTAAPTMPPPTTPAPTTVKPASGAWCGSDAAGVQACPTGEYCQPWDPSFYQCRYIDKATCGVQQTGVDFYGDDLTTVPTLLPEECCAKCRATSGCKAYTFVNYNADGKAYCYLKKGAGTPRPAVGAVSAVLPTSTTPAPTTRAPSTTAPATPTPSVCGVASGGQCGSASTGVTCCPSGEYCQPWDPYYYQCRPVPAQCGTQEVGVDYYGNDLQTIQGILPADCCAKCAATYGCKAYTFVNYNANWQSACYLKSGIGAKKSVVGAVSAIVLSPRASPCSFTRNIDFYGNDLQTITGVTEDQCCLSCQSTANCKAFTLVGSSCYLKTSSTGSKFLTGATSGVIG